MIEQHIIWLLLAFASGMVATRLKLPAMVGYLVAGAALGAAGARPDPVLHAVSDFGVLLLLFGVGLHLRIRNLINRPVLVGGGGHLVVSTLVFAATALALGMELSQALFLGLILSFSSTVLAAKDLENRQELGAYYGRLAIGILLVQDLVALGVIVAVGASAPALWALALPALVLLRPLLARILDRVSDEDLFLLLAVLLAIGAGTLFHAAGLPGEIGALLAGAMLADHPRSDELQESLWGLKEFFLVGFFLLVGMLAIPASPGLSDLLLWSALIVLILPFKAALFFGLLVLTGLRARTAFLAGSILTSYSEFTLMAGLMGVESGLIDERTFSMLALVTAASFAINLPVSRLVNALYERHEQFLLRFQRETAHPDKPLHSLGRADHVVVGMGRIGAAAYDALIGRGARPVGLDLDPVVIERSLGCGRRVVFADALDPELWDELSLDGLRAAIITVPNLQARLRTARALKARCPDIRLASYALRESELPLLRAAGIDDVHHILSDAGVHLAESI